MRHRIDWERGKEPSTPGYYLCRVIRGQRESDVEYRILWWTDLNWMWLASNTRVSHFVAIDPPEGETK